MRGPVMPRKAGKFYAVRCGHAPGVYLTWPECEAQIRGFRKAQHKSFRTRGEAEAFVRGEEPKPAESGMDPGELGVPALGVPWHGLPEVPVKREGGDLPAVLAAHAVRDDDLIMRI
ncbi:hypothetical protein TeGR_g13934, partial [Tetraparma gracilis]